MKLKKLLALMLALVMVFALAACNNSSDGDSSGSGNSGSGNGDASGNSDYSVAMVTDYGDITDQSFNQTTYEACKEYCDANNLKFTYYKPAGDNSAERVAMIEAAIADGYNIIVTPGFAFGEALEECAPLYPDVKFIALDVSEGDLGSLAGNMPDNLYCAIYQEELCGYMAGYAAVKLGYTKLGFLGGMALPSVMRYGYGYIQGADTAAVEMGIADQVSIGYVYGNAFQGDADITAYMDTWYSNGMEVVFACGGSIYSSVAEAAAKVSNGMVIGVDVDQAGILGAYKEGMTVTSAMKGLATTVKDTLADTIEHGNWANYGGKVATLGLVSGTDPEVNYVQIPMESTQWEEGKFTQDDYKDLVSKMYSGEITVSNDVTVEPETSITVNMYADIK